MTFDHRMPKGDHISLVMKTLRKARSLHAINQRLSKTRSSYHCSFFFQVGVEQKSRYLEGIMASHTLSIVILSKQLVNLPKQRRVNSGERQSKMERKSEKWEKIETERAKVGTKSTKAGTEWDGLGPIFFRQINTPRSVKPRFLRGFLIGIHVLWRKRFLPAVLKARRKMRKVISLVPLRSWFMLAAHLDWPRFSVRLGETSSRR